MADPHVQLFFWSGATVGLYFTVKAAYRRTRRWFLMPIVVTPALLIAAALLLHTSYRDYNGATHWLTAFLGPATVAFAVPIYEHRAVIRAHWQVLAIATLAGSLTAAGSAWLLASALGLDGALRLSLLPRSISTPFAMTVSADIGGIPELTAMFVVLTGLAGTVIGELMLLYVPVRSALARGTLLGMGAHGAGTAKAYEIGAQEGSIAGLTMVLVGLFNVLIAPLIVKCAEVS